MLGCSTYQPFRVHMRTLEKSTPCESLGCTCRCCIRCWQQKHQTSQFCDFHASILDTHPNLTRFLTHYNKSTKDPNRLGFQLTITSAPWIPHPSSTTFFNLPECVPSSAWERHQPGQTQAALWRRESQNLALLLCKEPTEKIPTHIEQPPSDFLCCNQWHQMQSFVNKAEDDHPSAPMIVLSPKGEAKMTSAE